MARWSSSVNGIRTWPASASASASSPSISYPASSPLAPAKKCLMNASGSCWINWAIWGLDSANCSNNGSIISGFDRNVDLNKFIWSSAPKSSTPPAPASSSVVPVGPPWAAAAAAAASKRFSPWSSSSSTSWSSPWEISPTVDSPTGCGTSGRCNDSGMPVRRYSTARCGLLNAALNAASTCDRSYPISMMFWMVASLSEPWANDELPEASAAAGSVVDCGGALAGDSVVALAGAGGGAAADSAAPADSTAGTGVGVFLAFDTIKMMESPSLILNASNVLSSCNTLPEYTNFNCEASHSFWEANFSFTTKTCGC